jgi:hypothetical protein
VSSQNDAEEREKSTVLKHVAVAAFPEAHLAPWMSILGREQSMTIGALKTIGDIAEELDRRSWLDAHPGEAIPEEMGGPPPGIEERMASLKKLGLDDKQIEKVIEIMPGETTEEEEEEELFRIERVRGASGMFGYCLRQLAINTHDIAPSIQGIGRRQAMSLGMAQKSGVAVEPKSRTLFEKMTGRGKDREKVAGGV